MAFVQVEDVYGTFEAVVFPKVYEQYITLIRKDVPVMIKGRANRKDTGEASVIASSVCDLNDTRALSSLKIAKNYTPQHKSGGMNAAKAREIKNSLIMSIPCGDRRTIRFAYQHP